MDGDFIQPRPRQSPQGGGASDPLVGRENRQQFPHLTKNLYCCPFPVPCSLFPRPKVGERKELKNDAGAEQDELAAIYRSRGLDPVLASQVAEQLMAYDALAAHARDELGISETLTARPIQAAFASAGAFAVGAAMPLLTVLVAPEARLVSIVFGNSVIFLTVLGVLAARAGGAPVIKSAVRVTFWGVLAMGLTAAVGRLFGTVV